MDLRIFMAGEANEPNLALLFRFSQSLSGAIRTDEQLGIVFEGDAVDLPQIEVVGM